MAQFKNIKTHEFDSIVIGGGLTGLIVANQLEHTGRKVALIEGMDTFGGISRPVNLPSGASDHVLKLLPESQTSHDLLSWLESVLDMRIDHEVIEAAPMTYDDGKFKPFIGFGSQSVLTASEIDAYAKTRYHRLSSTPKDWVTRLTESFAGTALPQSFVTKMHLDDEFVIELLVNGAKRYSAREIVFCATPQNLLRILPEGFVPARLRARLMKGEFWTSANLDLVHLGQVTDSKAVHVLKGANEEPCVGLFHDPTTLADGRLVQHSQWVTLVPRDITEEAEVVASALKQIKRQVKRAYESSLENLVKERIVVAPTSHGDLVGGLPEDGRWPKLQNLWVVSSLLSPEKNLAGALHQARRTLASLAGEPVIAIEADSELSSQPQPSA